MQKINLINADKSDIKFVRSVFPDGENHIKFTDEINRKDDYLVITRITNATELFELMQVGSILNRLGVEWELDIFYLMSMRMDRVISFNEAFSLEVVANMINSLHASIVRIYHPHSERTLRLINNSQDMESYYSRYYWFGNGPWTVTDNIVCYPDHGAKQRYCNLRVVGNKGHIVMSKVRDLENNGVIKSIVIEEEHNVPENPEQIIVYDDLCDAGGTFCWAASVLKEKYPNTKLIIMVRHMVNKVGIEKLTKIFDGVHITNSYKNWENEFEPGTYDNLYVENVVDEIYSTLKK